MNANNLELLQRFVVRFSNFGISADMDSLTLVELGGIYRFLMRLAEGKNGE